VHRTSRHCGLITSEQNSSSDGRFEGTAWLFECGDSIIVALGGRQGIKVDLRTSFLRTAHMWIVCGSLDICQTELRETFSVLEVAAGENRIPQP
jgi:hypothetical protein